MGSPLPVKVGRLLFVLFVWCTFFPVGEKVHSFCMISIRLNIFVCLFIILPQVLILSLFSAFRRFLVVYLVSLCQLYMSEMLFSTFLMRLLSVVSSPWKMLHLCIVNVSEVIIKTVFIKKRK